VPVTDIAGPPVYSRGGLAYDDCRPRRCMSSRARATGGGTGTERLTPGSGGRPALVDDTRVTRSAAARHPRSARTRSPSRARAKVSATASWCASSTACFVPADPSAHSGDADFTGVKTRSWLEPAASWSTTIWSASG
jgi:hypothetical protein